MGTITIYVKALHFSVNSRSSQPELEDKQLTLIKSVGLNDMRNLNSLLIYEIYNSNV